MPAEGLQMQLIGVIGPEPWGSLEARNLPATEKSAIPAIELNPAIKARIGIDPMLPVEIDSLEIPQWKFHLHQALGQPC